MAAAGRSSQNGVSAVSASAGWRPALMQLTLPFRGCGRRPAGGPTQWLELAMSVLHGSMPALRCSDRAFLGG